MAQRRVRRLRGRWRLVERHAPKRFAALAARCERSQEPAFRRRRPATQMARQGRGSGGAGSGCEPTSPKKGEGRAAERRQSAKRGHDCRRSRADRSRPSRVAQDRDPTAYMHTPSGRVDAQIGRSAQGARLRQSWPHVMEAPRHRTHGAMDRIAKIWGTLDPLIIAGKDGTIIQIAKSRWEMVNEKQD